MPNGAQHQLEKPVRNLCAGRLDSLSYTCAHSALRKTLLQRRQQSVAGCCLLSLASSLTGLKLSSRNAVRWWALSLRSMLPCRTCGGLVDLPGRLSARD